MALPVAPAIDVERFYALTRDWPERAELLDGEVVVVPAPPAYHQAVVARLAQHLTTWVAAAPHRGIALFAPLDVRLEHHTLVQPDLAWWAGALDLRVQPSPPPDLAVEVLSPTSRRRDVGVKRVGYARAGVPELWLVDPEARSVAALRGAVRERGEYRVLSTHDADATLESPLLPGLVVPVRGLFPD